MVHQVAILLVCIWISVFPGLLPFFLGLLRWLRVYSSRFLCASAALAHLLLSLLCSITFRPRSESSKVHDFLHLNWCSICFFLWHIVLVLTTGVLLLFALPSFFLPFGLLLSGFFGSCFPLGFSDHVVRNKTAKISKCFLKMALPIVHWVKRYKETIELIDSVVKPPSLESFARSRAGARDYGCPLGFVDVLLNCLNLGVHSWDRNIVLRRLR
mmetsp:Transcript_5034/g.10488  ORF Transcript_5034/g.10488 Transcript_5034/m.10488 type:complete len:213 (+) Transcript_5034:1020-1658(+)